MVLFLNEAERGIVVDWIYAVADCDHNKEFQIIFVSQKFKNSVTVHEGKSDNPIEWMI